MIATLEFPGLRVRAKPRPRAGKGHIYMPPKYLEWLEMVKYTAMPQLRAQGWQTVMSGPVSIGIWLQQKAWRADVDQISGAFLDALQGANGAYLDDCQIVLPTLYPEIAQQDNVHIILKARMWGLPDKGLIAWVRQGQIRQDGARKGRDIQKIQGGRKW